MAKRRKKSTRRRRRNPGALLVNPSRRRRRRNPSRTTSRRRRRNPRRVHHRRARRRNPGIGNVMRGGLAAVAMAVIPATLGAASIGFIDAKFLGSMGTLARNVAKLLFAGIIGTVGKKYLGPHGAGVAIGAVLGTVGHEFGVRLAGGMVTMSKKESVQSLIEQAATDGEMQAELGALLTDNSLSGDPASDFAAAMSGGVPSDYEAALAGEDISDDEY